MPFLRRYALLLVTAFAALTLVPAQGSGQDGSGTRESCSRWIASGVGRIQIASFSRPLMLSVETNDVSSVPGREVWKSWKAKLDASPW